MDFKKDLEKAPKQWHLCPLCQNTLQFEYEVNYTLLLVKESCTCHMCGFTQRDVEATLH